MYIKIITLFPEMYCGVFSSSILARAQKKQLVSIDLINLRDFARDKYKTVDDKPYSGGSGMLIKIDVLDRAIEYAKKTLPADIKKTKKILLDPTGQIFKQNLARKLSEMDALILICGHYEGIDARIKYFIDLKISIGEYVLTGGEIPAMVLVDATVRLIKGVLKKDMATSDESYGKFYKHEAPQYTRPALYKKYAVPQVLLSGNHRQIAQWKKRKQVGY